MNEEMIELCAEAKRHQDKDYATSGQARHQGFYLGVILAEQIWITKLPVILRLIAQVIRDYKAVPEVLAEIADGLETQTTNRK